MYEELTCFLPRFAKRLSKGGDDFDEVCKDTPDDFTSVPYVEWPSSTTGFGEAVLNFVHTHPGLGLNRYDDILHENGLEWDERSMENADVEKLDDRCVMALIVGGVRADHFCNGQLDMWINSGLYSKWLTRLKELDEQS